LTDLLAEDHCPIATMRRNSGPRIASSARWILSLKRAHVPSDLAGMFGHTEVQQHREMVSRQVDRILHEPRPLGSSTQPRVDVIVVVFIADEMSMAAVQLLSALPGEGISLL
jgi:hypothetical protein